MFRPVFVARPAALAACLMLAGCMGGGSESSFGTALFGNPQSIPAAQPEGPETEYSCPTVDVLEGAAGYRVGGAQVAWQASINDVVRECRFGAGQFVLRVGIEGRIALGPAGRPGTYGATVRISVKRGDRVVAQRAARIGASVGAGSAGFAHVEEISLPMTAEPGDDYEVFVGFDSGGGGRAGRR